MKLLIFDTETTSLKPGHICQISYIIIDASKKPQETIGKNMFFTVEEVDPAAESVHGFSVEKLYDLSEGLCFEDRVEELLEDFSAADFVIGHNVNFDVRFLKTELDSMGIDYAPKNIFCTMQYYRNVCKILRPSGDYKNPKLEEAIRFLGISDETISKKADELFLGSGSYHDARFDTAATYLLIIEGLKRKYIPSGYFSKILQNK